MLTPVILAFSSIFLFTLWQMRRSEGQAIWRVINAICTMALAIAVGSLVLPPILTFGLASLGICCYWGLLRQKRTLSELIRRYSFEMAWFGAGGLLFILWQWGQIAPALLLGAIWILAIAAFGRLMTRFMRFRAWVLSGLIVFSTFSAFQLELLFPHAATAATETIDPGAYIIDMGQSQTVSTGLKPYGMVFDLVGKYGIPVKWAISETKSREGVDFSADGIAYSGGSFIIPSEYQAEAASIVSDWQSQGVVVNGPTTSSFSAPIYATIDSLPNAVLDLDNGKIAAGYYSNAEIPESITGAFGTFDTYREDLPSGLTPCDDIYVMPHADPEWDTHENLIPFVESQGFIWAACHAVSVLERVDDPTDGNSQPDMNFLSYDSGNIVADGDGRSTNDSPSLKLFGDHADPTDGPYEYANTVGVPLPYGYSGNSNLWAYPIMQFLGKIDNATQNGSEQLYVPEDNSEWRPETAIAVYDEDVTGEASLNVGTAPPASQEKAVKMAFGPAYGVSSNGLVMYEAGHSHGKSSDTDNIAAQRAFFNFVLMAGIVRGLDVNVSTPATIAAGSTETVSATISGGTGGPYNYQWYSSCGGSFAQASGSTLGGVNTTFTAPSNDGTCTVRLVATDGCDRRAIGSSVTLVPGPQADLSITKTDNLTETVIGGNSTYIITVTNNSGDTLSSLTVTDDAASGGLENLSFTPSTGAYNSATGEWTGLNLAAGNSITLTMNATVSSSASNPLTNTATVSMPANGLDTDPGNNTTVDNTTLDIPSFDLSVAKTHTPSPLIDEGSVIYNITVTNAGPDAVNSLDLTDTMSSSDASTLLAPDITVVPSIGTLTPANPTFSGDGDGDNFTVTWSNLNLQAGDSANLSIITALEGGGGNLGNGDQLTNTVTITAIGDTNAANNTAIDTDTVANDIDDIELIIAKTDGLTEIDAGNSLTYTITVTNDGSGPGGTDNVPALSLVETLPIELLSPTFTNPSEGSLNATQIGSSNVWTIDWTGLDFDDGESITFDVNGTVDPSASAGTLTNTVSVTAPGYRKDDLSDNTATDTTTINEAPPQADLSITKTNNLDGVTAGQEIVPGESVGYVMSITNNGPSSVSSVTITDVISPANGLTNYTFSGPVSSTLSPTAPTFDGSGSTTFDITFGTPLAAGQTADFTLSGTVNPAITGTLNNTVTVAPPTGITDPDCPSGVCSGNNVDNDSDPLSPEVDLALDKTDGTSHLDAGETTTYALTVTNNGPSTVTSVTVDDPIPSNLLTPVFNPSTGSYDSGTGLWTGLNLAEGETVTLELTGQVNPGLSSGTLTNTATVLPPSGYTDPNCSGAPLACTGNNTSTDVNTIPRPSGTADLAITKDDGVTDVIPGASVTYTIQVTNNGPDAVNEVTLVDTLPSALDPDDIFFSSPNGSYDQVSGLWEFNTPLASGETATIYLDGTVLSTASLGTMTNTVTVTLPTGFSDPNTGDNTAQDIDNIIGPDTTSPAVLLVKRITAILDGEASTPTWNSTQNPNDLTPLNTFVDDPGADDTNSGWPSATYIQGEIDAGLIKPNDGTEYGLYFLSAGDQLAENVKICDRIPENQTFVADGYTVGSGIQLDFNGSTVTYTNASGDDNGTFYDPGVVPLPEVCGADGSNRNLNPTGAIVVDVGDLPNSTGTGTPNNSYGIIRFRATVD